MPEGLFEEWMFKKNDTLELHCTLSARSPLLTSLRSSTKFLRSEFTTVSTSTTPTLGVSRVVQLLLPSSVSFSPASGLFPGQQLSRSLFLSYIIPHNGTPIFTLHQMGHLDTAIFLGNASVPMCLVCIGAASAKLTLPKKVKDLPLGAISALALGRLILQPVVAMFVFQD